MTVVLYSQPANAVANIKKVVFPIGETAPMDLQTGPLCSPTPGVRARFKRVVHLFVGRVDGDLDAIEGDEATCSHLNPPSTRGHQHAALYAITTHPLSIT